MFFFYILTLAGKTFPKAWVQHAALIGSFVYVTPKHPYPFRALRAMAKSSNGKWQ